ncbi:MAG TPA: nitrile hydratase subunit alpha [Stellaceae bacterium]|nr:nitrile hydratase subunit alpha [Stellaceae bacterium]
MAEQTVRPHSHMQDFDAHVRALEEDLEYYRTKRFEPRVLYLHRRGAVTLYDLLDAAARLTIAPAPPSTHADDDMHDALEGRIRALEDRLDAYVKTIALTGVPVRGTQMVIDDGRVERGDYDAVFRIAKKAHGGTLGERVAQLEADMTRYERLLHAFTQALVTAGALKADALERQRAQAGIPSVWNGARIVARAWVDPQFRRALIEKGREAVRELDIPPGRLGKMGVAENTDTVHNVVVCTLCSCYPYDLLGDSPWWYKSEAYRRQVVRDPRGTLAEMFGLNVPKHIAVRVHDSTSDVRWMVLPRRPAGTDGWSEEELATLVTRESLIGTAEALSPAERDGLRQETGRQGAAE